MKQSVADAFIAFTTEFEGAVNFMYLDVLGLCTTGIGNLIDPMSMSLGLPWRHKASGELATRDEIAAAWRTVKARKDLAKLGGGHFRDVTDLVLNVLDVNALVQSKLAANDAALARRFPAFGDWPADAQLATHSMAWAMGTGFSFPRFEEAVTEDPPDFATAASQSKMSNGAPKRNAANIRMLLNAAEVLSQGLDPDVLYYPKAIPSVPPPPDTQPDVAA